MHGICWSPILRDDEFGDLFFGIVPGGVRSQRGSGITCVRLVLVCFLVAVAESFDDGIRVNLQTVLVKLLQKK